MTDEAKQPKPDCALCGKPIKASYEQQRLLDGRLAHFRCMQESVRPVEPGEA